MGRQPQPRQAVHAEEPSLLLQLGELVGRCFFPLMAIVVILGTFLWGPWVSLLLAAACWSLVTIFV